MRLDTEEFTQSLKERYYDIERLKDMKAKLSTKIVSEILEQHCKIELSKIHVATFPFAYF